MSRTGLVLLLAFAAFPGFSLQAAEVADLYEAQVPVSTQESADRETALGVALRRVLSKVSGQRDAASHALLAAAVEAPGRFVQQFQYRIAGREESEAGDGKSFTLWVNFDAEPVDALIREAGLPVWGRSRPSTLVWLSVEREGGRELVTAGDGPAHLALLAQHARRRGVPVVLPLLDLEDRRRVNPDELWAGFLDNLRAASARYDTEAVLLVRLREVQPILSEAYWSLLVDDSEQHWITRADRPDLLLEDGVHRMADLLAARYARAAYRYAAGSVDMVVSGVRTLEDYAGALRYLFSLKEVEQFAVDTVESGQVRFRVEVHGGRDTLLETVPLGSTLSPERFPSPDGALYFRLLR